MALRNIKNIINFQALNFHHMTKLAKILIYLAVAGIPLFSAAQNRYIIEFNEKGQINSRLPPVLTAGTELRFLVRGRPDNYEARVLDAYMRYLETIKNLQLQEDGQFKVLASAGLGDNNYAKIALKETKFFLAHELIKILDAPDLAAIIGKSRNLDDDRKMLITYYLDKPVTKLHLPPVAALIDIAYSVENDFAGGNNPGTTVPYPCPGPILLKRHQKKNAAKPCCTFEWTSDKAVDYGGYPFAGAITQNFRLRQQNSTYQALSIQVDSLKDLAKLIPAGNIAELSGKVQKQLDAIKNAAPTNGPLFDWMADRFKNDKSSDALKKPLTKIDTGSLRKVQDALTDAYTALFKDRSDEDHIRFLFEFCWLNRGAALTANPLQSSGVTGVKTPADDPAATLAKQTQALADLNQKITLIENVSKTSQAGAHTNDVLKEYDQLLQTRVTVTADLAKAQKAADAAKQKTASNGQDNNQTMTSDILLYAGILSVNPNDVGVLSPNHPYFHYMRSHNALTDLQQFDTRTRNGINETQHMDVYVINADPKNKYVLSTTFAAPSAEMDFLSYEAAHGVPGAGEGDKRAAATLETVYVSYSAIRNRQVTYQAGIMTSPLPVSQSKTPALVTTQVAHSGPAEAPKVVSYQINDPATGKNLNSESTIFSYRYNKLYRFRFKAGIAYSWLERRNYTIDKPSNTATYTTSYAGLAPTVGLQIFTTRIDIQKQTLFPASLYPYFYVGYMFNDAPVNNFLLGGGVEVLSGVAVTTGLHFGKGQALTVENGQLQTKDIYQAKMFLSVNIGLEAFKAIFNTAKPATNIFTK